MACLIFLEWCVKCLSKPANSQGSKTSLEFSLAFCLDKCQKLLRIAFLVWPEMFFFFIQRDPAYNYFFIPHPKLPVCKSRKININSLVLTNAPITNACMQYGKDFHPVNSTAFLICLSQVNTGIIYNYFCKHCYPLLFLPNALLILKWNYFEMRINNFLHKIL